MKFLISLLILSFSFYSFAGSDCENIFDESNEEITPPHEYLKIVAEFGIENASKDVADKVIDWYTSMAWRGHQIPQYNLAMLLKGGKVVAKNPEVAAFWFDQAALQGHPLAQYELALMREKGLVVKEDLEKAAKLYLKSAVNGKYMPAMHRLALLLEKKGGSSVIAGDSHTAYYWHGEAARFGNVESLHRLALSHDVDGVEENLKSAARLYLTAAKQDHLPSQYRYAVMSEEAIGIPRDLKSAAKWYKRSADWGYKESIPKLAKFYREGLGGIEKNPKIAFNLYLKSAKDGHIESMYVVAEMYHKGEGVEENLAEAVYWYEKLVSEGHAEAQEKLERIISSEVLDILHKARAGDKEYEFRLGSMYLEGFKIEKNPKKALEWFERAANQNHTESQYQLALLRHKKEEVQNLDEAFKWYKRSAVAGHLQAQINLAEMHYEGSGVEKNEDPSARFNGQQGLTIVQDYKEAARWYEQAALQGDAKSQVKIGLMNEKGEGFDKKNPEKAREWYELAVEQGLPMAQMHLDALPKKKEIVETDLENRDGIPWE